VFELDNKVGIITGAARGLGKYLALRLLRRGCKLLICDLDERAVLDTKKEIENVVANEIISVKADVTIEEDVKNMVNIAVEKFLKIDFLIVNAGVAFSDSIQEFNLNLWKKVIDVNLFGYFLCVKEISKIMTRNNYGSIVQINSRSGKRGRKKNSAYSASKGGGIILTQSLSDELAKYNIRVNCVCPGPIFDSELWRTKLFKEFAKKFNITEEEVHKRYLDKIPLGRGTTYKDVSSIVEFLISDESNYITGQAINISGGEIVW